MKIRVYTHTFWPSNLLGLLQVCEHTVLLPHSIVSLINTRKLMLHREIMSIWTSRPFIFVRMQLRLSMGRIFVKLSFKTVLHQILVKRGRNNKHCIWRPAYLMWLVFKWSQCSLRRTNRFRRNNNEVNI